MEPLRRAPARRPARRRRIGGAAALAALLATFALPPASQAQVPEGADEGATAFGGEVPPAVERTLGQAPQDLPPSPDDRFVRVTETARAAEDTAIVAFVAAGRANEANAAAFEAAAAAVEAQAALDVATDRRDRARATLEAERERLSALTVRAYVSGGEISLQEYGDLLEGNTTDEASGRRLMFDQVLRRQREVTDEAEAALRRAGRRLEAARTRRDRAVAGAEAAAAEAAARTAERQAADAAHLQAVAEADAARTALAAGPASALELVPLEVAIIGMPRLSAEDLSSWFATSAYQPRTATPIEDYARWFIEEGAAEGIRGDVAFAQAVLETGGFANDDTVHHNNFSGIGHCDSCASGWHFATPQLGVRAQIQLLKSYAVRRPDYTNPLVDRRLRGPAGCCDTWGDLTTVWATDPGYGPKVMLIYSAIVTHALERRAAGLA